MVVFDSGPFDGENASTEYGQIMLGVKGRLKTSLQKLQTGKIRSPDNGFMACVTALRVLADASPLNANLVIYKGQVQQWQDAHATWMQRMSAKIPDAKLAEIRSASRCHFERLESLGSDMPEDMWE